MGVEVRRREDECTSRGTGGPGGTEERVAEVVTEVPEAERLLSSREFETLAPEVRGEVLDSVERDPDQVCRMEDLLRDAEFRRMTPGSQAAEVRAVAAGSSVPSADEVASQAHASAPPRHGPGAGAVAEAAVHAAMETAEGLHVAATVGEIGGAAVVAGGVAVTTAAIVEGGAMAYLSIAPTVESIHAAREAREEGREWAGNANYASGYRRALEQLSSGAEPTVERYRGDAAGVARAEYVWDQMSPAERVELRSLPVSERASLFRQVDDRLRETILGG